MRDLTRCPFCDAPAVWEEIDTFAYGQARCPCGAVGVWFGIPADADEGAEQLLTACDLQGTIAPAPVPVGRSGFLSVTPYDTSVTTRQLRADLDRHGQDLVVVAGEGARLPSWAYWARARAGGGGG